MTTWTARPTTYKGVRMRSRLEATYAARLDKVGLAWEYEPRAFANEAGQYLPDFYLPPASSKFRPVYIEVKPTLEHAYRAIERIQIVWDSEPTASLVVFAESEGIALRAHPEDRLWHLEYFDL